MLVTIYLCYSSTCFVINHESKSSKTCLFWNSFSWDTLYIDSCVDLRICKRNPHGQVLRWNSYVSFLFFFSIVVFLYPLLIYIPFYRAPGIFLPASLTPFVFFSLSRVWFFGYVHVDFCRSWRKDANTALQAWFQRLYGFILFYTIDRSRGKFEHIFHLSRRNKWEI